MRQHVIDHIAAMKIVMARNCTLEEARNELARIKWRARQAASEAQSRASQTAFMPASEPSERPLQWWQRD